MINEILYRIRCASCGQIHSLDLIANSERERHRIGFEWLDFHMREKHNISLSDKRMANMMERAMNSKHKIFN